MEKESYPSSPLTGPQSINDWLDNEELPITIWENKYRNGDESFNQWLDRISGGNESIKQLIREKKFIFAGRILSNRGVKGRKITLSNCFTGDTRIMTEAGLKTLEECVASDASIRVLSNGQWRDASFQCFGVQPIKELVLRRGKTVRKFRVTGNHQWFVKQGQKNILLSTDELKIGDIIPSEAHRGCKTYKVNPIGVAHGFYMGDGDYNDKYGRRANICAGKEELLPYFMPDTVGNSSGVITISRQPRFFLQYPSLDEAKSYLYGWLAGYFAADGSVGTGGDCVLCSAKREDLEYAQQVQTVLGIPTEQIRKQIRVSNLNGEESVVYILSLNKEYLKEDFFIRSKHRQRFMAHPFKRALDWKVDGVYELNEEAAVYCAIVPDTSSFALEGGIKTHNCYVVTPPEDNLESIFEAGVKMARTFSYGGGCGLDVSKLRPKGAKVNNAAKSTSGTTSFMDFYSYITGLIGQEGRRGATMLSISCEHPDLEEFINLKSNLDVCTKSNISVRVTDAFMRAVESGSDFTLHFTMEDGSEIKKVVNAREIFMLLAKRNWEMAEPGVLFWDRISNYNMMQGSDFQYAGTNPCGEQPLPAGGACLLGSLNLSKFIKNPFTPDAEIDFDGLQMATVEATNALNEVLMEGLPLHPLAEQRESVADWRQIGLGTLGLGDALIKLGVKYGSLESLDYIQMIYRNIAVAAVAASITLAKIHGAFPKCTDEVKEAIVNSDFIKHLHLDELMLDDIRKYGLYNSQLLTCAPTGTIGTMLQVSTGVEPNFAFSYNRRTVSLNEEEKTYKVDARIVKEYKAVTGNDTLPDYFMSAADINYRDRIAVQAMLQRYIDASISSTVNLPNSTTIEDVAELYMLAWKSGLKGITIWRDGCQRQAILSTNQNKEEAKEESKDEAKPQHTPIRHASNDCIGLKRKLTTGCGSLHLLAYFDPDTGQLLETYFSKGSTGGCALFMTGLSRMVSLVARAGVSIEDIVDQLKSSGTCPSYAVRKATKGDTSIGSSCPVAIGNALLDMYKQIQSQLTVHRTLSGKWDYNNTQDAKEPCADCPKCPKCGEPVQMVEGCMTCPSCGYSKCS